MNPATTDTPRVPRTDTGLRRFWRSLEATRPDATPLPDEPAWRPHYVNPSPRQPETVEADLYDFGYTSADVRRHRGYADDRAYAGPVRLLTDEAVDHLATLAARLETRAPVNDYVVTTRLRAVEDHSRFVHDMLRDPGMLRSLSRIAGVPLIPHPFRDACVQINYYSAEPAAGGGARVAKWHTDGMDYVFTMLLTDGSGYTGGEYTYFRGPADAFDPGTVADDDRTEVARFFRRGEAVFTRGSHVYHAVTPVREGRRTTIAFSMFCPFFARRDSNSFWHSAPDDGLLRTIHNWWTFKMPWYGPRYYYELTQAPAIGWNEIGR